MKTDGEKRQMVKTVKFSYWLILLLFCTKKQNNKKRLFVSIIRGGGRRGYKKYIIPNLQSAPPHYTIISAINRHLGGGVII